ncbi:hypothetical protein [Taklimakanibacter albus]|uniref:Uncharacterized protein n=1 Tax=Taklimakanibacter albus TaxID=2800327 RepID=A0ACC5R6J0_9HYPH|nr:hypothetical protein [Aestuariivirga sp. YIM B02566]MBK1868274.1 hypothetical protein [Aestuariivirga sp. YIM B02566]
MLRATTALFALALLALPAHAAPDLKPWQIRAKEEIGMQLGVRAVEWTQAMSLWVYVTDDGKTKWNAWASSLCVFTRDIGRDEKDYITVTVLDHAASARNEWQEYAKAYCD